MENIVDFYRELFTVGEAQEVYLNREKIFFAFNKKTFPFPGEEAVRRLEKVLREALGKDIIKTAVWVERTQGRGRMLQSDEEKDLSSQNIDTARARYLVILHAPQEGVDRLHNYLDEHNEGHSKRDCYGLD